MENMDIKKLTSDDIMLKWLKKKEAENISPAGLNQRKATLSRFYTYYMGLQMLSVNIPKTINIVFLYFEINFNTSIYYPIQIIRFFCKRLKVPLAEGFIGYDCHGI